MKIFKRIDTLLCKHEKWRDSLTDKQKERVYISGCVFAICFLVCGLLLAHLI